jgi:hypothetical protein
MPSALVKLIAASTLLLGCSGGMAADAGPFDAGVDARVTGMDAMMPPPLMDGMMPPPPLMDGMMPPPPLMDGMMPPPPLMDGMMPPPPPP